MTLDEIDTAVMLRNHRKKALELKEMVSGGCLNCRVVHGETVDIFSVIAATPIRDAIQASLDEFIAKQDAALAALGVETPAAAHG